ncbi:MAG: hypothetical protein LBK82_07475 [Planctomycetaceae bacterium]|nr:hypothetical protein [Planctomycetaceae bacterium]
MLPNVLESSMPSQPARPFSEGIAHHFSPTQSFSERLPCLPTSLIEIFVYPTF